MSTPSSPQLDRVSEHAVDGRVRAGHHSRGASLGRAALDADGLAPAALIPDAVSAVLLVRYLVWRYQVTLPPMSEPVNWLAGWTFFVIEVLALTSALLSLMFLSRVRDRSAEADTHEGWERADGTAPMIDVLICTVNEEQRILEHTILGAIGMDYPNFRIWVLDDGRRPG